jgi:hypothetical protein
MEVPLTYGSYVRYRHPGRQDRCDSPILDLELAFFDNCNRNGLGAAVNWSPTGDGGLRPAERYRSLR